MRKHRIENAAYEVATQVRAVEDTIDAALTEMAELQSAHGSRANRVDRRGFAPATPRLSSCQPRSAAWSQRAAASLIAMRHWPTAKQGSRAFAQSPSATARIARRSARRDCASSPDAKALTGPQQCGPVVRKMLPSITLSGPSWSSPAATPCGAGAATSGSLARVCSFRDLCHAFCHSRQLQFAIDVRARNVA